MIESNSTACFSVRQIEQPPAWLRLLLLTIGIGLLSIFAVAVRLKPDPRGFGTHQQLGLPACHFRSITGLNCPHCGMTTSFSHLVRGQIRASWQANPMGLPLALLFGCAAPWCILVAMRGRWLLTSRPFHWFVLTAVVYLTIAALSWIVRVPL